MRKLRFGMLMLPLLFARFAEAQSVGIGTETPNTNAILELVAPNGNQGLLVPRLTTAERTAASFLSNLTSSDNGLLVFDTDVDKFFFWIGDQWIEIAVGNLNGLPDQVSQSGKFLSTNGSVALWSDLDFTALSNVPSGLSDGDDIDDADADASNELQNLSLSGSDLTISSGNTVDLSGLQDGVGTDDQNADEVNVTPTGDLSSSDVQSALEELQGEIVSVASASIPDNAVTTVKLSNGAVTDAKVSDVDFSKLTSVPAGLADGDDDTTLSDSDIGAFGYLKSEVDGSTTNEIQDISFDGANLSITSGSTLDLTGLQDGTGTDDQTADEVSVTPSGDLTSADVQSALVELQGEIVAAASASIPDNAVTTPKISNGAVTNVKIASVDFSKLTSVPAGLSDGDDDTQLDEVAVDGFVSNNGYLTSESDPTVPANLKDGVDWSELSGIPANIADGDDDTQLNEADVDGFVSNNGYLTSESDPTVPANLKDGVSWGEIGGIPAGIADGDDDTQLDEAAVDGFVSNNGYLTSESDPTVPANLKDGVSWGEIGGIPAGIADGDDDTQLDEAAVDGFVSNNGYLTSESDPTVPANLKDGVSWGEIGGIPAGIADGDDDTQLTEAAVDGFVSNNGYLTSESDPTVPANLKDGVSWGEIGGIPAGIADGDDDTQLNEAAVDGFVSNNGYLTSESDPTVPANLKDGVSWGEIGGIPAGIADGDDDTQLNEAAVDAFVSDNGYLTSESDPTVPANLKDGVSWGEIGGIPAGIADGDDDTQLDEAAVDAFVSNNGYLTSVPANSVTTTQLATNAVTTTDIATGAVGNSDLATNSVSTVKIQSGAVTNVKITSMAFSKLTSVPAGLSDGDDQLSDSDIEGFGYIKSSVSAVDNVSGTVVLGVPKERVVQLSGSSGESVVNGFGAGFDGQEIMVINVSGQNIVLNAGTINKVTDLVLGNGTDINLGPGGVVTFVYSSTLQAWLQTGGSNNANG